MSISSALSNATSGLSVASRRADVVSNNIANALTPGFAKRNVHVSAKVLAGNGAGVQFDGVTRAVDSALTGDRRLAESASSRDQVVASAYASFNSALGEPDDSFSLFAQYQNLESSLRSLSQTPESQSLQAQTLDAAKALISKFHDLSGQAQSARLNADGQIAQEVDVINNTLKEIEKLNTAISAASAGGRDATALEDQRKVLIDQVSQSIPVREVQRDRGKVDLITDEGVFLIAGTAREITFSRANTIGPDESLAGGDLSGLSVDGADITPGGGGSFAIGQGSLAGLFAVRDQVAPDFQTKLDGLARDMIERFEGIDPTLAAGSPGLFTDAGAAFDPTAEIGVSARIAINAAADPDQGGAAWRLRDGLGAVAQGPAGAAGIITAGLDALTALKAPPAGTGQSGFLSAANVAANVTSSIGQARITSETQLAASSARTQSLIDAEQSATAVDSDQELQKLLLIEQAFAANARVIQTADEMMRRLMEL
jgi:flagellar hook-associated protein 1 FlgK